MKLPSEPPSGPAQRHFPQPGCLFLLSPLPPLSSICPQLSCSQSLGEQPLSLKSLECPPESTLRTQDGVRPSPASSAPGKPYFLVMRQ